MKWVAVQGSDASISKGGTASIAVQYKADVATAGDVEIQLFRSGDNAPVQVAYDQVAAGNNVTGSATFTVDEPGAYYAVANGLSSLDNGTTNDQDIVLSPASVTDSSDWAKPNGEVYTFDYNVDRANGTYTVTGDEQIWVESVTDVFGNEVDDTTYSVVYLNDDGTIVAAEDAVNGRAGGFPKVTGSVENYQIAVVQADLTNVNLEALQNLDGLRYVGPTHVDAFVLKPATIELSGLTAYHHNDAASDNGLSDTTLPLGGSVQVGIAVNGKAVANKGISVAVKSEPHASAVTTTVQSDAEGNAYVNVAAWAGTYVLTVVGDGTSYTGQADVTFTIDKLDLATADVAGKDYEANGSQSTSLVYGDFTANGDPIATADVQVSLFSYTDPATQVTEVESLPSDMTNPGAYVYQLEAKPNSTEVSGQAYVTVNVYGKLATFEYSGTDITDYTKSAPLQIVTSLGQSFNPNNLMVCYAGEADSRHGFAFTVENEAGEQVTDYSQPGLYKLTATADTDGSFSKGGSAVGYFRVYGSHINAGNVDVWAAVDGKMLNGTTATAFPYKAAAYDYDLVVKEQDGGATVDPSLYEVALTDAKTGEAVEAVQEVGAYEITVSINDAEAASFLVDVTKADLVAAKATADFFALPADGSAAAPSFVLNTKADFKGLSLDATAENSDVVYWNADRTERVSADDLIEAGTYWAEITVLSTEPSFETPDSVWAEFSVQEFAGYADVDANAWYSDEVYDAKGFGYMEGIPGTNLFMPEAQITRAQTAQVLFNMAGGVSEAGYYPTEFSDVNGFAWYAQPVMWASQAGVVTGMGDTGTFAPDQNVTREQAAAMLYRYMQAQGKAEAATADLSAYADAASVSSWAAEAMQWAVANGVFGVGTDLLRPQDNLSRAEMAAIAVRVQPDGAVQEL